MGGSPSPSYSQGTNYTSDMPVWIEPAHMELVRWASEAARLRPFPSYQTQAGESIPRIAGFDPLQNAAFQAREDMYNRGDPENALAWTAYNGINAPLTGVNLGLAPPAWNPQFGATSAANAFTALAGAPDTTQTAAGLQHGYVAPNPRTAGLSDSGSAGVHYAPSGSAAFGDTVPGVQTAHVPTNLFGPAFQRYTAPAAGNFGAATSAGTQSDPGNLFGDASSSFNVPIAQDDISWHVSTGTPGFGEVAPGYTAFTGTGAQDITYQDATSGFAPSGTVASNLSTFGDTTSGYAAPGTLGGVTAADATGGYAGWGVDQTPRDLIGQLDPTGIRPGGGIRPGRLGRCGPD